MEMTGGEYALVVSNALRQQQQQQQQQQAKRLTAIPSTGQRFSASKVHSFSRTISPQSCLRDSNGIRSACKRSSKRNHSKITAGLIKMWFRSVFSRRDHSSLRLMPCTTYGFILYCISIVLIENNSSLPPGVHVWLKPRLHQGNMLRGRATCCPQHVVRQHVARCRQHVACISATSLCIQQQTGNKLATILLTATSNMLPATCCRQRVALV